MSEDGNISQAAALNKLARDKGIILDGPGALTDPDVAEVSRELTFVQLPRQGCQLSKFAREMGAILRSRDFFRREGLPVRVNPESGRIEEIDPQGFRSMVEAYLVTYVPHFQRAGMIKTVTSMSMDEARAVLACDFFRFQLRKIQRVHFARQPVMRSDGRIELLPPGYDDESQIFTLADAIKPEADWSLERAKLYFDHLLSEFPFTNPRSRAVHVCAMLSVLGSALRPAKTKPLNFVYKSNRPRAGKGLLVQTAVVPTCGFLNVQAIADSREEFKKTLDTEALNGSSYIFFDEIVGQFRNPALNAFLTSTNWGGRLMNTQRKFEVPQNSIVFLAGNNVELSPDLAGRFLVVDLYVQDADAQARSIKEVIDERYMAQPDVRRDCLSALWALVRHWNECGRPQPSSVFRGFEAFSNIFGGIVQHAGFGNPLESAIGEIDPEFSDMQALVERASDGVLDRAVYDFRDLIEFCRELNLFEWRLEGKTNKDGEFELNQQGKAWFGKLFSQRFGGTQFVLRDARKICFGKRGRQRHRKYTIEILPASPDAAAVSDLSSMESPMPGAPENSQPDSRERD